MGFLDSGGPGSARKRKSRKKPNGLEESPQLVPLKQVAAKFAVTPACIRNWMENREFVRPHAVIGRTWLYRADVIDHKLRTGHWPAGAKFLGDFGQPE